MPLLLVANSAGGADGGGYNFGKEDGIGCRRLRWLGALSTVEVSAGVVPLAVVVCPGAEIEPVTFSDPAFSPVNAPDTARLIDDSAGAGYWEGCWGGRGSDGPCGRHAAEHHIVDEVLIGASAGGPHETEVAIEGDEARDVVLQHQGLVQPNRGVVQVDLDASRLEHDGGIVDPVLTQVVAEVHCGQGCHIRVPRSPSEDYLAVLAGQRQWIATTNFAGCPGQPQIALRIAPCSLPRRSS